MAHRGVLARPAAAGLVLTLLSLGRLAAQEGRGVLRDSFESESTAWRQEKTDATIKLFAHDRTARSAREGRRAEHFQFDAGPGSGFYFSYGLPKVPVKAEVRVSLQARSDRAGVQILGRVILPGDVDPETNQPSYVVIPGTILDVADRWGRLELIDIPLAVERQARVLRASTRRKVSLEGAYLDRLVVNLYAGQGPTEVYLDDLRIEPVPDAIVGAFEKAARGEVDEPLPALPAPGDEVGGAKPKPGAEADPEADADRPKSRGGLGIEFQGRKLTRQGFPWVPTLIRAPGADPAKLRRAGFKVLALPADADPEEVKDAVARGFALMPEIDSGKEGEKLDPDRVKQVVDRFPAPDKVAFWSLGRGLGGEDSMEARHREHDRVRDVAQPLRKQSSTSNLSTGDVVGDFADYARMPDHLDLIGVTPFGWGTTQEPRELFAYLEQRRNLTAIENPDALYYPWLTMSPAPAFREAIWGKDRPPAWGVPRVQAAQLRQMAYIALSAGCRGLGFEADEEISQGSGRALLLEAALINEEIDLTEWLLADTNRTYRMLSTYRPDPIEPPPTVGMQAMRNTAVRKKEEGPHPSIRAAAFGTRDRRGTLLLIADYSGSSQFQPPQMALNNLKIDVPAPNDAIAYEISPGDVEALEQKRTVGGIRITVPEFGPTSLVYITTDGARIEEIQRGVIRVRPQAVNLAIEQAQIHLASAVEVNRQLADDGHTVPESDELLQQAVDQIKTAQEAQERQDYRSAWKSARRAQRPLQSLLRLHWDKAFKEVGDALRDPELPCGPEPLPGEAKPLYRVVSPVAVPPLVSINTLPQAWVWKDWISRGRLTKNLLKGGDFESPDALQDLGWALQIYQEEGIKPSASSDTKGPGRKSRCLKLVGVTATKADLDRLPAFEDHPVVGIRTPPIPVYEAEIVRIAVHVKMDFPTAPGAGGVIVRDSIGGEPLQFRSSDPIGGWQEVVLYRRAPADGQLTVTLAYAGRQYAFFDNLRIQKLQSLADSPGVARQPTPPAANPGPARPPVAAGRRGLPATRPPR